LETAYDDEAFSRTKDMMIPLFTIAYFVAAIRVEIVGGKRSLLQINKFGSHQ